MLARLFSSTKDFVSVLVPLEEEANADIFREFNIVHLKYFNVKIRRLLKIIHSFEIYKFIFDYGFFKPKNFFWCLFLNFFNFSCAISYTNTQT